MTGKVQFEAGRLEYSVTHPWTLENNVEKVVFLGLSRVPTHVQALTGCGKENVGFYVDNGVVTVKLVKAKMNENWSLTFIFE